MTKEQRKQIYLLRKFGLGYQAIGKAVGLSRDSVRSYCKSHGMAGVTGISDEVRKKIKNGELCLFCAGKISQSKTGRPAKFCCDQCRREYWKIHRNEGKHSEKATYTMECKFCHRIFEVYGNKGRKYCSHRHYIYDRYGFLPVSEEEFYE